MLLCVSCLSAAATDTAWRLADIRIRDPFILADELTGTYYMYAQMDNRLDKEHDRKGVEVYTSKDLETWRGPHPVFVIPQDFWANNMVWAPEVHEYRRKYYLFVTFTAGDKLPGKASQQRTLWKRGTQILVADSPKGPFKSFHNRPHTPADWSALDGTLWVEDGVPWMVFCHEWTQIDDGSMELVQLKPNLSDTIGEPATLFHASDAPWVRPIGPKQTGYVTDGPFLYRTQTGELLMIWSSFGVRRYAVAMARSVSGKIAGPWEQLSEPLFAANGGHGMIFRTFEGGLMLILHQPNSSPKERAALFELRDTGNRLQLLDHSAGR